ncbi:MAG TPA: sugar phosphate isomerase/epimerase [Polyangiaceae bacterium]|nr:sugar phosphate isomerase/epimerase [Polyangiaceae bacterium]
MKISQIAVQCYTLREHLKTAADFAASMKRVRAIGYQAVQISGVGPISPAEIRRMTDAEGLKICATHEPGEDIVERPEAVVEVLSTLGCALTAYPFPHKALNSRADVEHLADALNRAGAVLQAAGMVLTYHNHELEFRKFEGQTVLEILFERTDRSLVQAELDTYWVQAGGADPVAWCERMAGRLPMIHLKDYAVHPEDRAPVMAALGEGNLDFPRIVAAAERSGCQWFIVEQDRGFSDAFAAIDTSFKFLSKKIAS